MPWFMSLIPDRIKGRYFATEQLLGSISGVLTLLLCAALFALLPLYKAFTVAYIFALAGAFLTVLALSRLPDVDRPSVIPLTRLLRRAPQLCLEPGPYRYYLLLCICITVLNASLTPFVTYYLKVEAGLSQQTILVYSAVQYGGAIAAAFVVRGHIDTYGVKPFFLIAVLLNTVIAGCWLMVLKGVPGALVLAPFYFFLLGVSGVNWFAAHLKYLPQICALNERPLAISVQSAVVGFLGGISPMFWGLFIKQTPETTGGSASNSLAEGAIDGIEIASRAGVRVDRFAIYLIILMIGAMVIAFFFTRLKEQHPQRKIAFSGAVPMRLWRYMASLVNLVDTRSANSREDQQSGDS